MHLPQASASGTMRIATAALTVILTAAALCTPASASPYGSDTTPCCFAYLSLALPRAHVKEYFYTSSKCSNLAVVPGRYTQVSPRNETDSEAFAALLKVAHFVTRRNRQVCANPEKKWVQEYINYLEMS